MNVVEFCYNICTNILPIVIGCACILAILSGGITLFLKYDQSISSDTAYEISWFITRIFLYIALTAVALLIFISLVMGMYETAS